MHSRRQWKRSRESESESESESHPNTVNRDSEPEVDTKHYTGPTVPKRRLSRKRPNDLGHIVEDTFTVWSTRATLLGIHVDQLRRLVFVKAPPVLFHIYRRLKHDKLDIPADLEFVETFCGAQALCHGFLAFQWRAVGLDLQQHEIFQNVMSPKGFGNHLGRTQRMVAFVGFQHHGVVCSPFVWHCRATTGRDSEMPTGFVTARNKHHDIMVNRSAMLMLGSPVKCLNSQAVQ